VADLKDEGRARSLLEEGLERASTKLRALSVEDLSEIEDSVEGTLALRERILALGTDVGLELHEALKEGKSILLEGAQGTALDLDHGTYPYVTSSITTAGGAASGSGIGPTEITEVLGVTKAYITRVGEGPLPTGFEPEMDEKVRELGAEFGATTGRPRRCGWFDGVLARYAARVNGFTGLAVTKMDVLDTLPEISVATAYRTPEGVVSEFPACTQSLGEVEPVYEALPGWEASTAECTSLEDLPANARAYLDRLAEITETPVKMVSVGTRRRQIIRVD
jgi:adenylosuccinate synthase